MAPLTNEDKILARC